MANEIQIIHDDAAETVYAVARTMSGMFLDGLNGETFDPACWGDYAIALSQVSAASEGVAALQGDFPDAEAGFYRLDLFLRHGASPAVTDFRLATVLMYWDGAELTCAADWIGRMVRSSVAVLAGNMTFDEATGQTSFTDAEDAITERASYVVSPASVGRSQASVS